MAEPEKSPILKARNLLNFSGQRFYKISEVLRSAHIVSRNTENNIFYFNNFIDCDHFNQLYNSEW